MNRRDFMIGAAALGLAGCKENFTTMICQSPPGGVSDQICQIYKLAASKVMGEDIRIQGIPTGGGVIAAKTLVSSPADGSTFGMLGQVFCSQQFIGPPEFNQDDFSIIGSLALTPMAMVVSDAFYQNVVKVRSEPFHQILAFMENNPGKVRVAYYGLGGGPWLAIKYFEQFFSVTLLPVPFRVAAQASISLAQDDLDMTFGHPNSQQALIDDGKAHIIVVGTEWRLETFPDVPTFNELGFNYTDIQWFGMFGPKGLSQKQIDHYNLIAGFMYQDPECRTLMKQNEILPWNLSRADFLKYIDQENVRYSRLIH